ncbi:MAG: hypothetical protein K2N17_03655, partial [Clostridia bacterium]|nr:hypothetical protein [Clostridia bacterium]
MRKKILAMLLCLVTALGCAFGFTACGGGGDTGDGGNGGDKTEQTTPNDKTDDGNKKPEQTEKPGNDDKTEDNKTPEGDKKPDNSDDDKKGDDEKEPDGSGDDKTDESKNYYQDVVTAVQAKLDDKYGEGAEILTIYTYKNIKGNDYLALKIKYGNAIKDIDTGLRTTSWLDKNDNIIDANQANLLISRVTLTERVQVEFVGKYFTDSNDILAESVIKARVGTDYDIICGAVSDVTVTTHDSLTNPV